MNDLLKSDKDAIFLTGAQHLPILAKALKEQKINVLVILTCPRPADVAFFSAKLEPQIILFKTAELSPKISLGLMLNNKIAETYNPVQVLMKEKKELAFPEERQSLERLYSALNAFNNLADSEFQKKMATLEYAIGSLHHREKEISQAIEWTEKSLDRKIKYKLGTEFIKSSEDKLETLKAQISKPSPP